MTARVDREHRTLDKAAVCTTGADSASTASMSMSMVDNHRRVLGNVFGRGRGIEMESEPHIGGVMHDGPGLINPHPDRHTPIFGHTKYTSKVQKNNHF